MSSIEKELSWRWSLKFLWEKQDKNQERQINSDFLVGVSVKSKKRHSQKRSHNSWKSTHAWKEVSSKSENHPVSSWASWKWSRTQFSFKKRWITTTLLWIRMQSDLSSTLWRSGKRKKPQKITSTLSLSRFLSKSTQSVYPSYPISESSQMKMPKRLFSLDLLSILPIDWIVLKPILSKKFYLPSFWLKL